MAKFPDFKINRIIDDCLEKTGFDHLDVEWEWNNRLTSTMGCHKAMIPEQTHHLEFSAKLFNIAEHDRQVETIVHEVAHAIAVAIDFQCESHGETWQYVMGELGYPNAEVCYNEGEFESVKAYQKVRQSYSSKRYVVVGRDSNCQYRRVFLRRGKMVKLAFRNKDHGYSCGSYHCGTCGSQLYLDVEASDF